MITKMASYCVSDGNTDKFPLTLLQRAVFVPHVFLVAGFSHFWRSVVASSRLKRTVAHLCPSYFAFTWSAMLCKSALIIRDHRVSNSRFVFEFAQHHSWLMFLKITFNMPSACYKDKKNQKHLQCHGA